MTDPRATRATISISSLSVEGFMLPDGSYRMSQTQAAECVGLNRKNVSDFIRTNAAKALLGEVYTCEISEIEPDSGQGREPPEPGQRGTVRNSGKPSEPLLSDSIGKGKSSAPRC